MRSWKKLYAICNGNMLTDLNKGMSLDIAYNHLNLPTQVTLPGGNIQYIYDATGTKLKKTVSRGATTYYAGNYVYEDTGSGDVLKFFNHPEGYVQPDGAGFEYVYQYKDHLGNIRLAYSDSDGNGTIIALSEIIKEIDVGDLPNTLNKFRWREAKQRLSL